MRPTVKTTNLGATLVTYEFPGKNVKIHTYMSPYEVFADSTHIIETDNNLVLIDSQYLKDYAKEFRAIGDSLHKPIAGVIISHGHPDHVFGLDAAFKDVPVYALPGVINSLTQRREYMIKENKKTLGDKIADDVLIPQYPLNLGEIRVDGLLYKYSKYTNAESDETLVIELPELGVFIPQDLVSSGVHLWLTKDIKHWINILKELPKYPLILGGHGLPVGPEAYDFLIEYLTYAQQLIDKYGKDNSVMITKLLVEKYPYLKAVPLIGMSLSYF